MSLAARLLNVFAVPRDVFDEIKASRPSAANWLVPAALLALVGAVAAIIIFSQPAIQQKIREEQARMFDKQVQSGKMTRDQAEQGMAMAEKFSTPTMLKVLGAVGAAIGSLLRVLWWAFILWLLGRWLLKAPFGYSKALEVAGLALMIGVLGTLVSLLLTVNMARLFAGPSLALAITDFDDTRKSHLFAGAANVFSFWLLGVLSVGLARLTGVPFIRAAFVLIAFWLMQESFLIMVGLGKLAL